jgi:hypothetical protein
MVQMDRNWLVPFDLNMLPFQSPVKNPEKKLGAYYAELFYFMPTWIFAAFCF